MIDQKSRTNNYQVKSSLERAISAHQRAIYLNKAKISKYQDLISKENIQLNLALR